MRGHIAKKGNRYYAVIYEGVDPATGKDKRRWHSAGDNRKDAERVLADLIKRVHDGDYRAPDKITLGDYMLKRWLPTKRARLKPSTAESYERIIRLHINPNIGNIPVQKAAPRGPRRALRPPPHRRQTQRRGRRPVGPDGSQRPRHHPGRAL